MSAIVIVSGSPSDHSTTDELLSYIGETLIQHDFSVKHISVKDVPAEDLMFGNFNSPVIKEIGADLQHAQGVIVGSSVYKASYSGVLKALFDVLPEDVLHEKPVLPIMTGGSPAHMLAVDYALKPLLSTVKGETLSGLYFLNKQMDKMEQQKMEERTKTQMTYFMNKVKKVEAISI